MNRKERKELRIMNAAWNGTIGNFNWRHYHQFAVTDYGQPVVLSIDEGRNDGVAFVKRQGEFVALGCYVIGVTVGAVVVRIRNLDRLHNEPLSVRRARSRRIQYNASSWLRHDDDGRDYYEFADGEDTWRD